jgi:predicted lipid-binding transport protein (Tim44 family)
MKQKIFSFFILTILILSCNLLFAQDDYIAYSSSKIFSILIFAIIGGILVVYSSIISIMLFSKRKKANKSLKQFQRQDSIWNHPTMTSRIEEIFFEVHKAWTERDQNIAKESLTQNMFLEQKRKTDKLIKSGRKNVLESINLVEASIISVTDFKDNSKDIFSSHIKGKMINYIIDDKTEKVISGDNKHYKPFEEIWHFKREGNKWVLSEIDQKVTVYNLIDNNIETE